MKHRLRVIYEYDLTPLPSIPSLTLTHPSFFLTLHFRRYSPSSLTAPSRLPFLMLHLSSLLIPHSSPRAPHYSSFAISELLLLRPSEHSPSVIYCTMLLMYLWSHVTAGAGEWWWRHSVRVWTFSAVIHQWQVKFPSFPYSLYARKNITFIKLSIKKWHRFFRFSERKKIYRVISCLTKICLLNYLN